MNLKERLDKMDEAIVKAVNYLEAASDLINAEISKEAGDSCKYLKRSVLDATEASLGIGLFLSDIKDGSYEGEI